MSTVKLEISNYRLFESDELSYVIFIITEQSLNDYLDFADDSRTSEEFMKTYTNGEAMVIYEYATDDGMILYEDIKKEEE